LQNIVTALQDMDYVTGVTAFTSPAPGGYVISFVKSGNITIANGQDGADGESPQINVKQDTDGVYYWTLNGEWIVYGSVKLRVTGEKGTDGQNAVTPKIRINTSNNEWEISYNNGVSWNTTGVKATGDKGDAVFAANGVDYSNSNYVEFTLADGVTKIKVPKYKKLGLHYTQPEIFSAGETKVIPYTPEGDVSVIKFLNVPSGWTASVDYSAHTFTVTAPATFNSSNSGGEVIILVSDNDQNVIMRTINFNFDGNGGTGYIAIDGYSGNTVTVYYTDNTSTVINRNNDNVFAVPYSNRIIKNIILEGGLAIIAGRKADGSAILLKLSGSNLALRDAVGEYIPIGTYSEFQLIQTKLGGTYKQEANLDLLNLEWTPIGSPSSAFAGTFEGDNHTLANLKISGNNDYVGVFRNNSGIVLNVHVISGTVSGREHVGGVCGITINITSKCSNNSNVSGVTNVGGVCGAGIVYDCYNFGTVSGSGEAIGGVCGGGSAVNSYNTGNVSGVNIVGGVIGRGHMVMACYNTGVIFGSGNYVGGVCGYFLNSTSAFAACYNTGNVSGGNNSYVGGICGYMATHSVAITACYNTGAISGSSSYVGGICGRSDDGVVACYWKDIAGDNAGYGIGYNNSNTGTNIFSHNNWPTTSTHLQWGVGGIFDHGKFWKSLGSWNNGNPIYPKLWYEE
jgi:hypothetical protein